MRQLDLLERAIRKAGSAAAIARLTGRQPPRISLWRSGKEPIPDEVVAYLAKYLGDDPIEALAEARGGLWEKISSGFDWLLSHTSPHRSLIPAG